MSLGLRTSQGALGDVKLCGEKCTVARASLLNVQYCTNFAAKSGSFFCHTCNIQYSF